MTNPCVPTCPERSATCHATCPKYAGYAEFMAECRKKRTEHLEKENIVRSVRRQSWLKGVRKHGKP